ncbi:MAG TPA: hypothetical protein VKK79_23380 [Candidatus Lokiarchaeia archaeon]|nr:hypothetical protein [Candidatus Lokiarchaeia archaeon]
MMWPIEGILLLIASVPIAAGASNLLILSRKTRLSHIMLLGGCFFAIFFQFFAIALGIFSITWEWKYVGFLAGLAAAYFLAIVSERMRAEKVGAGMLIVTSIIGGFLILTIFLDPTSFVLGVLPSGAPTYYINGTFQVVVLAEIFWVIILSGVVLANIIRLTPKHLKDKSYKMVIVCWTIFIIIAPTILIVSTGYYFIAALAYAVFSLVIFFALRKNPTLFSYIPVELFRVAVLQATSGIGLFTYTASAGSRFVDDDLFSGMIQGLSAILRESMRKGHVKQIELEQAVVLFLHDAAQDLVFVVVASKVTKTLKDCLENFRRAFIDQFADAIRTPANVDQFAPAETLIHKHFPFTD